MRRGGEKIDAVVPDGIGDLQPEVAVDPVEEVDDDGVAGPGVGQELVEAVAVDGGAGLLVDVDPCPVSGIMSAEPSGSTRS